MDSTSGKDSDNGRQGCCICGTPFKKVPPLWHFALAVEVLFRSDQSVSIPLTLISQPVHLILSPGTRIVTREDANHIRGGEVKWKHAMHLMCLVPVWKDLSGIIALREGELLVRLNERRDALLTIKRGEQPWPGVNAWGLCLRKEFDEVIASTSLHERPDYV